MAYNLAELIAGLKALRKYEEAKGTAEVRIIDAGSSERLFDDEGTQARISLIDASSPDLVFLLIQR